MISQQYIVKRMPLSGGGHDPSCSAYEPPDELSGLGMLMGSAIQVDLESGLASLKLDISLSKVGSWARPVAGADNSDSVSGDTKRLSLRSLLHYLWHEAELTAWTSRWTGKRHCDIRWHLIEAARQMTVKGGMLSDILFVPEPFRSADKTGIEQRRATALAPAQPPKNGPKRLMILLGEIKGLVPAQGKNREGSALQFAARSANGGSGRKCRRCPVDEDLPRLEGLLCAQVEGSLTRAASRAASRSPSAWFSPFPMRPSFSAILDKISPQRHCALRQADLR